MTNAKEQALGTLDSLIQEQRNRVKELQEELEKTRDEYIRMVVEYEIAPSRKTFRKGVDSHNEQVAYKGKYDALRGKIEEAQKEIKRLENIQSEWKAKGIPQKTLECIQELS